MDFLEQQSGEPNGGSGPPLRSRVLMVDDNATMLRLMQRLLNDSGLDVTTATDAREALALARQHRFDVLLVDMRLRGASGLDVLREAVAHIPLCFVVTGYIDEDQEREAFALGAAGVLMKPLDTDHLFRLIREKGRPA